MIAIRLFRLGLHLIAGLWLCGVVFRLTDAKGRERGVRAWSQKLLDICRVQLRIIDGRDVPADGPRGAAVAPTAMIVANHISWLDIFVINAMQPCHFIAKSDIRDWPVAGWLSERAGTVFIARGNRRELRRTFEDMVGSIAAGNRVAFFPEGTTAQQGTLLPFHANLFEAAIDAAVPVQPYALRYFDAKGAFHPAVDYVGDISFRQSIFAVLRGGGITAQLLLLSPIQSAGAHRRDLAKASWLAVARGLGLQDANQVPAADTADNRPETAPDLQAALR